MTDAIDLTLTSEDEQEARPAKRRRVRGPKPQPGPQKAQKAPARRKVPASGSAAAEREAALTQAQPAGAAASPAAGAAAAAAAGPAAPQRGAAQRHLAAAGLDAHTLGSQRRSRRLISPIVAAGPAAGAAPTCSTPTAGTPEGAAVSDVPAAAAAAAGTPFAGTGAAAAVLAAAAEAGAAARALPAAGRLRVPAAPVPALDEHLSTPRQSRPHAQPIPASRPAAAAAGPATSAPPAGGAGAGAAANRQATLQKLISQDEELQNQREELASTSLPSSVTFLNMVAAHNSTLEHISDPAMAARDAAQHKVMSEATLLASRRLQRPDQRTPGDLVQALLAAYGCRNGARAAAASAEPGAGSAAGGGGGSGLDWKRMYREGGGFFRPAPAGAVLFGALGEAERKRRVVAQRRGKEALAELVRPTQLPVSGGGTDAQEHDSHTSRVMDQMFSRLMERRSRAEAQAAAVEAAAGAAPGAARRIAMPEGVKLLPAAFVPWEEVVCDVGGFAQTVENVHALCHIVGKKRLWVHASDAGSSAWSVAARTEEDDAVLKGQRKRGEALAPALLLGRHRILSLDMVAWRAMCARVGAARCLMPSRPVVIHEEDEGGEGSGGGGAGGQVDGRARAQAAQGQARAQAGGRGGAPAAGRGRGRGRGGPAPG